MFKERFVYLCNSKKESPSYVCKQIGLSPGAYSQWSDNTIPRQATLVRIADYFGVSVDYLKGTTPHENISNNVINDNHGIIGNNHSPVTIINGNERQLTEQEVEILKMYNNLSSKNKAKLFLEICKFAEDNQQ